jgi:hypothetical protein
MNIAAQVSIGGRKEVLEDGADVCNSESDGEEDHGETLTGMHKSVSTDSKGNPIGYKLTSDQAAALRAQQTRTASASSVSASALTPQGKQSRKGSKGARGETQLITTRSSARIEPTKSHASRAGGLRPAAGSGQTDTCVVNGNPSET